MDSFRNVAPLIILPIVIVGGGMASLSRKASQGGWGRLAGAYPSDGPFNGPKIHFRYLRCGTLEYAACLSIGVNQVGMFLEMTLPIFRFRHRALFIPWEEIEARPAKYLFVDRTELRFRSVPNASIQITKRTGLRLKAMVDTKGAFQNIV
jgi:hypothetical protein